MTINVPVFGVDYANPSSRVFSSSVVSTSGSSLGWQTVSTNTDAVAGSGYVVTAPITITLPSSSVLGGTIEIYASPSGVIVAQNSGQVILMPNGVSTTTGTAGTITSVTPNSAVTLTTIDGGVTWIINYASGTWVTDTGTTFTVDGLTVPSSGSGYYSLLKNGAGQYQALPVGSAGTVLTSTGSTAIWSAPGASTITNLITQEYAGQVFPTAGSAPNASFISLANIATTAYTASAYTGLNFTYTPVQSTTKIRANLTLPLEALGYAAPSSGNYVLPPIGIAIYTAQSGTPVAVYPPIQAAFCTSLGLIVPVTVDVNSSSYTSGLHLFVCLYFDSASGSTSSEVGVCINGTINASTKVTVAQALSVASCQFIEHQ